MCLILSCSMSRCRMSVLYLISFLFLKFVLILKMPRVKLEHRLEQKFEIQQRPPPPPPKPLMRLSFDEMPHLAKLEILAALAEEFAK